MEAVTVINAVLLGMLGFGAIAGLVKGLIRQLVELIGIVGSFFLAMLFSGWLAPFLQNNAGLPYTPSLVIAFLVLFVGGVVAFHFTGKVIHNVVHMTFLGWVDRFCGAVLGLIVSMLITSAMIGVALELPVNREVRESIERSEVSLFLQPMAPALFDAVFSHDGRGIAHKEIFRRSQI